MAFTGARLWLVRHGQTDWNAQGRVQGHTPTSLNERGRAQARALAAALASKHFAAIYASDLPRAAETADILAAGRKIPVQQTPDLRERSFGVYEGKTSADVRDARTALGLPQTGDLADWTGMPGIETEAQLWARIDPCLRRISELHADQDVLVATHGGVVARALYHTLDIPEGRPRRFSLSNGIVAVLQWRVDYFYLLSLIDFALLSGDRPTTDTATVAELRPSA
ncbi:MAG TPA: histidine phosphatase family protein [Phycisphaerae bacterium]|nr:histidine phosphatase family protein [Phycisphaerae bacterium]